ncbi:molybdate ABC transporter substrate-binding protein [Janibacter melonis]|uniref:molybdate ABC transporter substrate-binding protein n=1 Tax=Janibacter melonis TaxID=262209 RepID=UPI00177BCB34|nr:molybdate ABC transporter substrate-binding protein [Janibacter melonis]
MTRPGLAALAVAALGLSACSSGDADGGSSELTVFAAASLQRPLEQIADDFEADHPGVTVRFSFAGSSDLAAQLVDGAPADVLATADERTMGTVEEAGLLAGSPQAFATNSMTVVVPKDNPAKITSLADLQGDVDLVLCAPQVPCGAAAERVEEASGLTFAPVSEEAKVTDVLGKVASGEADAGIVYVTDAQSSDDVGTVEIPDEDNTTTTYPVAPLAGSDHRDLADELVAAVLEDAAGDGEGHLEAAGFAAP